MDLKRTVPRFWIRRWTKSNGITHRIYTKVGRETNDTNEDIKAMEKYEAQLEEIHQHSMNPSTIWNMDQISVKLQNPYRKTLAPKEANEIPIIQPPEEKEEKRTLCGR